MARRKFTAVPVLADIDMVRTFRNAPGEEDGSENHPDLEELIEGQNLTWTASNSNGIILEGKPMTEAYPLIYIKYGTNEITIVAHTREYKYEYTATDLSDLEFLGPEFARVLQQAFRRAGFETPGGK